MRNTNVIDARTRFVLSNMLEVKMKAASTYATALLDPRKPGVQAGIVRFKIKKALRKELREFSTKDIEYVCVEVLNEYPGTIHSEAMLRRRPGIFRDGLLILMMSVSVKR